MGHRWPFLACSMEQWPQPLHDVSFKVEQIELSELQANVLLAHTTPVQRERTPPAEDFISEELRDTVEIAVGDFGQVLPRLGLLSFKRPFEPAKPVSSFETFLDCVLSPNARVHSILRSALRNDFACIMYLREWHDIPSYAEFRVFVRDRKIIGISQYNCTDKYPEIASQAEHLSGRIADFVTSIAGSLPVDDAIVDVAVEPNMRLIDINPFLRNTDPCLFSWSNGGDFDHTFRFVR